MSEALIGVVIGGVLSGLGAWIAIVIQHQRWVIEKRIKRLNEKRERLEMAYERTLIELSDCMKTDVYSAHMSSNIDFLFPEVVFEAFDKFVEDEDKSEKNKRVHYFNITYAMKRSLKNIEDQIDEIILKKSCMALMKDFLIETLKKRIAKSSSQDKEESR